MFYLQFLVNFWLKPRLWQSMLSALSYRTVSTIQKKRGSVSIVASTTTSGTSK